MRRRAGAGAVQAAPVPAGRQGGGAVRGAAAEGRADLRAAQPSRTAAALAPRGLRHLALRAAGARRPDRPRRALRAGQAAGHRLRQVSAARGLVH